VSFVLGPKGILVCLLDIYKLFNERDPYYLLNQLYIEDYAVWIQKVGSSSSLLSLISTLEKVTTLLKIVHFLIHSFFLFFQELNQVTKADLRFDLPELEFAAKLVEDEEEEMEEELSGIADNVGNINIT
jgi:protein SHQ1